MKDEIEKYLKDIKNRCVLQQKNYLGKQMLKRIERQNELLTQLLNRLLRFSNKKLVEELMPSEGLIKDEIIKHLEELDLKDKKSLLNFIKSAYKIEEINFSKKQLKFFDKDLENFTKNELIELIFLLVKNGTVVWFTNYEVDEIRAEIEYIQNTKHILIAKVMNGVKDEEDFQLWKNNYKVWLEKDYY